MSEEVKPNRTNRKKPCIVSAAAVSLMTMTTRNGTGKLSAPTAWRITPPPANAVGNASGTRMSMVTTISRCAAIAIITATPDAVAVMLFCTKMMPTIWMVKHTAVTATRMNVKKQPDSRIRLQAEPHFLWRRQPLLWHRTGN